MRWSWFKRDKDASAEMTSSQALEMSDQELEKVRRRGEEVRSVVEQLRQYREENHFSEMFLEAIKRI